MFAARRSFASAVLLFASLSGYAASGLVLAHVASDHGSTSDHAHHHGGSGTEHGESDHGEDHAHAMILSTPFAAARLANPSPIAQPSPAAREERLDLHRARASLVPALPARRAGPLEPQRRSILLL